MGPSVELNRPSTKDHLWEFSHKTSQLTTQSIFYLSVGGWEFMVKALGAPLGLVSMESYPTTRCDWGMPFFSTLLKCAAYSDSGYCGAHKWLSEEKGMEKERVGSRFKRKALIGSPFLLSNLLRHKKSYSLIPKNILRERKGGYRTAFFVAASVPQSSPAGLSVFTLLLHRLFSSWIVKQQAFLQEVHSLLSSGKSFYFILNKAIEMHLFFLVLITLLKVAPHEGFLLFELYTLYLSLQIEK